MTTLATARTTAYTLVGRPSAIRDRDGKGFDADLYSLMKHGDTRAIHAFGSQVANALIEENPALVTDPAEVLLPVAYMTVPPSCYYLSQVVANRLNEVRRGRGLSPARIIRISKDSVTQRDYASSTQAEREEEMRSIQFTLDEPITGAQVVLVDDIRVTGLAERTAVEAMAHDAPTSLTLAYIAVIEGDLVDEPHVEMLLNHSHVRSIMQMVQYMYRHEFVLTIRYLKRCLKAEPDVLEWFLREAPLSVLAEMLDGARSSGKDFAQTYAESIDMIRQEVRSRV